MRHKEMANTKRESNTLSILTRIIKNIFNYHIWLSIYSWSFSQVLVQILETD